MELNVFIQRFEYAKLYGLKALTFFFLNFGDRSLKSFEVAVKSSMMSCWKSYRRWNPDTIEMF